MSPLDQKIPTEALNWSTVDNFRLMTILGTEAFAVEKLASDEYDVLRPGEDLRIRKAQIRSFCAWMIEEKASISSEQLRYILHTLQIKQSQLARAMLLSDGAVSQFLSGTSKWKASSHRQLALLILNEVSEPGYTLRLAGNHPPIDRLIEAVPYSLLAKRGWVPSSRNIGEMKAEVLNFFGGHQQAIEDAFRARYRVTDAAKLDPVKVGCWIQRFKNRAKDRPLPKYSRTRLVTALPKLLKLTAKPSDAAQCAPLLEQCGIHLFVENQLEQSNVDGVSFFLRNHPVIGVTLRYDRIDWFWFTLLHHISHLVLEHDMALPRISADPLQGEDPDEMSANTWAREQFLPLDLASQFHALSGPAHTRIKKLALKHQRHEGFVVGRLQYEGVIGQNEGAKLMVGVAEYLNLPATT